MSSTFDWSQFEEVTPEPNETTFDWSQFEEVKPEPSRTRSLLSAPAKGLLKGLFSLSEMVPISPGGPIPKHVEQQLLERVLPTQKRGPEQILERAGELAPLAVIGPEGALAKGAQVAGGALAGHVAKEAGLGKFGETVAEVAGMLGPGLASALGKKALSFFTAPAEKMASGLTKFRVVGAKGVEKGIITPEAQKAKIQGLNQEAAKLAKETVSKELPITKRIEEGFDFEKAFEEGFGDLQKSAERFDPQIDIKPVREFLNTNVQKYRGIPKLHPEAAKVVSEISAFARNPQSGLKNLLKIYRSNNKKIKNIFETSRLTGKQQEYVDFLTGMNKNISNSFENTLPKNSPWVEKFKKTNQEFKQFRDALKTTQTLSSVLDAKPTPGTIQKLATDLKKYKELSMSMGKKGADEIVQIAKDLKEVTEAIKKIPAKKLNAMDAVWSLSFFVPGLGKLLGSKKAIDFTKRGYGWFLTTPARRNAYQASVKALKSGDVAAYTRAAQKIKELEKAEEE